MRKAARGGVDGVRPQAPQRLRTALIELHRVRPALGPGIAGRQPNGLQPDANIAILKRTGQRRRVVPHPSTLLIRA